MPEQNGIGGILLVVGASVAAFLLGRILTGDTSAEEVQRRAQQLAPSGGSSPTLVFLQDPNPDAMTQSSGQAVNSQPDPRTDVNPDRATTGGSDDGRNLTSSQVDELEELGREQTDAVISEFTQSGDPATTLAPSGVETTAQATALSSAIENRDPEEESVSGWLASR